MRVIRQIDGGFTPHSLGWDRKFPLKKYLTKWILRKIINYYLEIIIALDSKKEQILFDRNASRVRNLFSLFTKSPYAANVHFGR
jgi:hypothetical protein